MNLKKANDFLGYSFYTVGASKIILIILAFLKFGNDVSDIVNNNALTSSDIIILCSGLIGIAQIVLAIAAVVMIFINMSNEPKAVKGYLYSIGAILIEIFAPSFLMIFFIFAECGLYMKAGTILVKSNSGISKNNKRNEELTKNTEWFFDENRENERINHTEEKKEELPSSKEKSNENVKGITPSAILIAWIITIAFILIIYLIQDMVIDNKKVEEVNTVIPQNKVINTNVVNTPIVNNNTNTNFNTNTIVESVHEIPVIDDEFAEVEPRLVKIVNEFNKSEIAITMFAQGNILTAIVSENEINIFGRLNNINTTVVFNLDGDILSTEIVNDRTNSQKTALSISYAMYLLDSIGKYKGYPEKAIIKAFNNEASKYYTIENEGVELKQDPITGNITIKADLSKDFSFLNNN